MNPQNLHAHEDRLLDFVYGELPVPEARVVEAHLQGCARCTQALQDIRGVRATMSQLSTQEPAPDAGLESLLAYAHQAARRNAAGPAPKPSRWRRWLLPVVGLASVSTFGILTLQARNPALTEANLSMAEVRAKDSVAPVQAPSAELPAAQAQAEPQLAMRIPPPSPQDVPAEKVAEESKAMAKREAPRAEDWLNGGSGGGVGTSGARKGEGKLRKLDLLEDEARPQGSASKELAMKPSPVAKSAPSKFAELDEESTSPADLRESDAQAPKQVPPRESLRLGGTAPAEVASSDDAAAYERQPEAEVEPVAEGAPGSVAEGVAAAPSPAAGRADEDRASYGASRPPSEQRRASASTAAPAPAKKAKRSAPVAVAAAPPPPPASPRRQEQGPSVTELSRRAQEAYAEGDRAGEVALLRSALAAQPSASERLGLLNRLCDAELALGRLAQGRAACNQVLADAPGSAAAQVARSRLSRGDADPQTPGKAAGPSK
ncbi:anti-sigma factor [Pyxidicoccus xibeiensis]|uniref:anti-sigma factor n=1 Tax=Pyxidicoccus xibeiensis TaxID=2906759 RepID=UPI0020A81752|nr:zf-HC2 domain-containing protein [Pyxidicoccus xibeiensis]MCP3145310.1 zf-HC2 domain-containing protein [Pyxidicoccus xibeiensis]